MSGIKYYVLDTETTGLNTSFHEIIELSIIRAEDRVQFSRNIKAEFPQNASFEALQITGKTQADLKYGEPRDLIVKQAMAFFEEDGLTPNHRCIVAHNAPFDRRFLHSMWEKSQMNFPAVMWLDTMALARAYAKKEGIVKPKLRLPDVVAMIGSKRVTGEHNAKDDARNAYLVWKKFIDDGFIALDYIKRFPHGEKEEVVEEND